jgi:hypothetical protein
VQIVIGVIGAGLLALALIGFYYRWKSRYYRRYGKKVEREAIAGIRLPRKWEMVPNKPVPGLGDADIFICAANGKRWNIEIKSYEGAKKVSMFSFNRAEIVRHNGRKFERDPIVQVLRVARRLQSHPVLWMPKAPSARTFKTKSGVLVVQGHPKKLERAIKARPLFWIF